MRRQEGPLCDRGIWNTTLAIALLLFYALVASRLLPPGINQEFVTKLYQWLLMLLPLICCVLLIYRYRTKQGHVTYSHRAEAPHIEDVLLLLLPMTPIVRCIIVNQETLTLVDSATVLTLFLAGSGVMAFLVPAIVGMIGSRKIAMMVGLSFSYVLCTMASLASNFSWHLIGSAPIQIVVLAVSMTMCVIVYSVNRKLLYVMVAAFFAVSTVGSLIGPMGVRNYIKGVIVAVTSSEIYEYTKGKEALIEPDIFLLVYDSYVENETMLQYGIDNSAQEGYLVRHGFHIYRGTYSLGAGTRSSMDSVLNVRSLFPRSWRRALKIPTVRDLNGTPVSGNNAVNNILQDNGYETFGIFYSDYWFGKGRSSYDHSFPMQVTRSYRLVSNAILEGQFRFEAELSGSDYVEYLLEKKAVLASTATTPRFLYAHGKYPGHSQNSGLALGNEIELFKEGLAKANEEMKEDIETITTQNPDALIIVSGDHGPYLTKNCTITSRNNRYDKSEINRLDIQDRFGSLLAIKWPDDAIIDHEQIEILQDIFPSVFAYLYDDASILKSRIEQVTFDASSISGVRVRSGIIEGGTDDGQSLFEFVNEG